MSSIFFGYDGSVQSQFSKGLLMRTCNKMEELVNTVAVLSAELFLTKPTCSTPKSHQNSCHFEWVWWKIGDSANKTPRLLTEKKTSNFKERKSQFQDFCRNFCTTKTSPSSKPPEPLPAEPEEKLRVVAYRNLVQRVLGTPQSETSKNPLKKANKNPWKITVKTFVFS